MKGFAGENGGENNDRVDRIDIQEVGKQESADVPIFREILEGRQKTLESNRDEVPRDGRDTLAVRKGMAPAVREKLKKALVAMSSDPEGKKALARFGATRFIETSDEDFKPMYDLVRHLKIDLANYQYKKSIP